MTRILVIFLLLGGMQARLEVRLNVARAYRDVGALDGAARQSMAATAMLDSLFTQARHLTRVQDERAGETLRNVRRSMTTRRSVLLLVLALGFLAASLFGVWTWRAITLPLDRLTNAASALAELYTANVERGTPSTDRVAELTAEISADASARAAATTEMAKLLGES